MLQPPDTAELRSSRMATLKYVRSCGSAGKGYPPSRKLQNVHVSFPPECRPLRLDLNRANFSHRIVPEAAPGPIFRPRDQSALYGIAVHVP